MLKIVLLFIVFIFIVIVLVLVESRRESARLLVRRYTVKTPKLKEGETIRIALLADLHEQVYRDDYVDRLLTILDDEKPDLLLTAGDMMIHREINSFHKMKELYQKVGDRMKLPSYYAFGNHEKRATTYPGCDEILGEIFTHLKESGTILLRDESDRFEIRKTKIRVDGLDIPKEHYRHGAAAPIDGSLLSGLEDIKKEEYTILISHHPDIWDYAVERGYDLTVSGHIHGGMVWIPFVGGLITPQLKIGSKRAKGCFINGDQALVVSAGLGDHKKTIRINNPTELVIVNVRGSAA